MEEEIAKFKSSKGLIYAIGIAVGSSITLFLISVTMFASLNRIAGVLLSLVMLRGGIYLIHLGKTNKNKMEDNYE